MTTLTLEQALKQYEKKPCIWTWKQVLEAAKNS